MPKSNRREFLKKTSASVAGIAALEWTTLAADSSGDAAAVRSLKPAVAIPPHRALTVPGVHAYATEQSVLAGEPISFCVSATVPYRLSVCRLGLKVDDPAGDEVLHEFSENEPAVQPIQPGSYIQVEKRLSAPLRALSLECWVRPWKTDRWAGLMTQYDFRETCGLGLFLNPSSGVTLYLGDGGPYRAELAHAAGDGMIQSGEWHHVVATWDGDAKSIWINGRQAGAWWFRGFDRRVLPGNAPLRLAAYGEGGVADHFLDGDLAMPVIYDYALSREEIELRFKQQGLNPAGGEGVVGCWTLAEEKGARVRDASPAQRHGEIINHATWMIGGPGFQAEVPRFDDYEPAQDPKRGNGLRFASDDLYDCRWQTTHQFKLPSAAKPGFYVGRIEFKMEGKTHLQHATFIVRRATRRQKAPILLLAATNTWRAYGGTPFGKSSPKLKQVWGTGGTTNSPGDPPAYCFYRNHAAGQGTYQLGFRMPWPAAGPYILYGGPTDYSHLMRADRFTQTWLEKAGYDFDIAADYDLHRHPQILKDYRAFIINGHSEYWSVPMYEGLRDYLDGGGNVICLSGNSLFWRVSFNDDGSIIECRKVDAPGDQLPPSRRGECWHSQDGKRGGLLRECGHPGWKLVGLETLGWINQSDPDQFGPYLVEDPEHFLFQKPEPVGVKKGDAIGQSPDGGLPRANGHEIDVRLSTLAALQEKPAPAHAAMPKDPAGIVPLANGVIPWKKGGAAFDYFFRPIKPKTDQGGEVIYWERPDGGKVFNAGAIGSGWALSADPKFQRLFQNVLAHFGVDEKS